MTEEEAVLSKTAEIPVTPQEAEILGKVLQAVRQIKFGYVQLTIQDGKVVQIDRTEKYRFNHK